MIRKNKLDLIADTSIILFMLALMFVMIYPFIYAIAYSLSDSISVMLKNINFLPIGFTLENYKTVFQNELLFNSFMISVLRTVVGIIYSTLITGLAAYAISKTRLPGNRKITLFLIIPMYISGGLLPTYILIANLNLMNTFWVYILPYGFWAFNMLIMRTFYDGIPASMEESAEIDGASELVIFARIIFPLSLPVFATIALFNGVWHWNQWFDVLLYITNEKLLPMQSILQQLIRESLSARIMAEQGQFASFQDGQKISPEGIKMATLIVATIPIVLVYPFLQKYFIKGIMIGAVKG
jgi:putative aldouronate transport system permease protein